MVESQGVAAAMWAPVQQSIGLHTSLLYIYQGTEPVFLNVDGAQESIPPAYVTWQACTTNKVVVTAHQAGNRFLGYLKGLQIRPLSPISKCRGLGVYSMNKTGGGRKKLIIREMMQVDLQVLSSIFSAPSQAPSLGWSSFKGTVSRDRFKKFWLKFTELGFTKGRCWFLNFLGAPLILYCKKFIYCG